MSEKFWVARIGADGKATFFQEEEDIEPEGNILTSFTDNCYDAHFFDSYKEAEEKIIEFLEQYPHFVKDKFLIDKIFMNGDEWRPHTPLENKAKAISMNIVNQLFDLAEVPVVKRQAINDRADEFVLKMLNKLIA